MHVCIYACTYKYTWSNERKEKTFSLLKCLLLMIPRLFGREVNSTLIHSHLFYWSCILHTKLRKKIFDLCHKKTVVLCSIFWIVNRDMWVVIHTINSSYRYRRLARTLMSCLLEILVSRRDEPCLYIGIQYYLCRFDFNLFECIILHYYVKLTIDFVTMKWFIVIFNIDCTSKNDIALSLPNNIPILKSWFVS